MSLAYREDGGTIGPWGCMVTDASGTLAGVLSFSTAVFDVSHGVAEDYFEPHVTTAGLGPAIKPTTWFQLLLFV